MRAFLYAAAISAILASPALSGPEEAYLKTAQIIYEAAGEQDPAARAVSYAQVREILDRIVVEFPSSDIAVRILLQDSIDGLDVAALDEGLAAPADTERPAQSAATASAPTSAPGGQTTGSTPDTSVAVRPSETTTLLAPPSGAAPNESEAQATNLPKSLPELQVTPPRAEEEIIKDVQTELNRLGCSAGTADGVAGRNTRAAFRRFINDSGSSISEEELATEAAVSELKARDGTICVVRTMASTSASSLSGRWGFRGDCPGLGSRVIRNEGRLSMKYAGNNTLKGTATNQQGISGPATIQFQGSRTAATVIKFGFFTLKGNLTRSSRNMSISGTGSRNCKISVWKN